MAAPSLSASQNNRPFLQHVDKVIADNRRFLQSNRPQAIADELQLAGKKAANHSRGWVKSALIATATYFIGRTLFNAIFPKVQEGEPDFEQSEKEPHSLSTTLFSIAALTTAFKWFGKH
jgi:hypothetical protein